MTTTTASATPALDAFVDPSREVRVRIAPSPTGDPHVGTGYIGLFNLAFARRHGGKFILRIEDTDQVRSTRESEAAIFDALRWLGIEWDEGPDVGGPCGPYRQSERAALHRQYAEELVERGHAYYCFCSKERLDNLREHQRKTGQRQGYDRHCRNLSIDEAKARIAAGESAVIRMKAPLDGETRVFDLLRGIIKVENDGIDDQVLLKADGFPTYHLANVVDDHLMGISHVIRGEEWLISTPKHVILYEQFGWEAPRFCHLPLLRNPDRSKLSKRKNPVSINYYRKAGYLPEALRNYLALMGWTMPPVVDEAGKEQPGPEIFSLEEMFAQFDLSRVSLGGPIFDLTKLAWMNGKYLREKQTVDAWVRHLRDRVYSEERLRAIAPLAQERVEKFDDFHDYVAFFFNGNLTYRLDELVPGRKSLIETAAMLRAVAERFDKLYDWQPETSLAALRGYCEESGEKTKDVFMSVRVAVTGSPASPPLDQCLYHVGRDIVRHRLRDAVNQLEVEAQRRAGLLMPGADTRKKRAAAVEDLRPRLEAVTAAIGAEKSIKVAEATALVEKAATAARMTGDELRKVLYVALRGEAVPPTADELLATLGKDKALQLLQRATSDLVATSGEASDDE